MKFHLERAATDIGIGRGFAIDRIVDISERLPAALKETAEELENAGFAAARELSNILDKKHILLSNIVDKTK